MAYTLTPETLASISMPESAFGTTRLLPDWDDIPEDFRQGNLYTELAEALFYERPLPDCVITLKEGFDPSALNFAVRAHLTSFAPKHEHKITGVGFMIAAAATLSAEQGL